MNDLDKFIQEQKVKRQIETKKLLDKINYRQGLINEKEQAWYGWTHRGCGKFYIGYQVVKDSICDCGNHKYPFTCQTLEDCKMLAIDLVEELS